MRLVRGMAAMMIARLQQYLNDTGQEQYFQAADELADASDALDVETLDLLVDAEQGEHAPYHRLIRLLGGVVGQNLLDLSIALLLYPQLGNLLKSWRGNLVTPQLAFFIENDTDPSYEKLRELYERASKILTTSTEAEPFYVQEFFADNRLFGFLNEDNHIDHRLDAAAWMFYPEQQKEDSLPLMIHGAQCQALEKMLADPATDLWLRGPQGCGKKYLLRRVCLQQKKNLLFADMRVVFRDAEDTKQLIWLLRREALLQDCDVCLYGISTELLKKAKLSLQEFLYEAAEPFWKEGIRLIFSTTQDVELVPQMDRPIRLLELMDASREERIILWRRYLELYGLELDAVLLGSKYHLSPAEIQKAVLQLKTEADAGHELSDAMIQEKLLLILPPVLSKGTIEPHHANCTMDSLVLPPKTKETLQLICNHVRLSHQVFDEWNMESRFAYGKAVSVLLCGPPGTGKTMTARVLSDELGLPLYHVNLSQLVDKYIGETEKHLEEIFTNAQKNNLILFFDEADSVFSKRSEVTDSKDKYANTEVSFILQRLEAYDGIVILATNYLNNIDPAFLRRMQYTIIFYLPGVEERRDLWKHMIPPECPTDTIDFDYLAEQFELTGSSIKSAVLTAAFAAAGAGEPLGMKHLVAGIKNEYVKKGKPIFAADFGVYGYLC